MPTDAQRWCILLIVLALPPATAHLLRRWRSANPVDVVVKLGGSALTNKASFETLHADNLRDCCENIAQSGKRVAVVHGAGSFGHFRRVSTPCQRDRETQSFPGAALG